MFPSLLNLSRSQYTAPRLRENSRVYISLGCICFYPFVLFLNEKGSHVFVCLFVCVSIDLFVGLIVCDLFVF